MTPNQPGRSTRGAVARSNQEAQWVVRAQCDDRGALEQLLRSLQPSLYRYVRGLIGDVHADDVVQDVLIAVARELTWLGEPTLVRPCAFRIASRAAFRRLRKERRLAGYGATRMRSTSSPRRSRLRTTFCASCWQARSCRRRAERCWCCTFRRRCRWPRWPRCLKSRSGPPSPGWRTASGPFAVTWPRKGVCDVRQHGGASAQLARRDRSGTAVGDRGPGRTVRGDRNLAGGPDGDRRARRAS